MGVDIAPGKNVKIVHDLMTFPWPFEDNSVDEIECSHYVEHIPHGDGYQDPFFKFFDECYRILKPKGTMNITTPYYMSMRAFQDPTHMRMITETSYLYIDKDWRKREGLDHYPISCNFKTIKIDHGSDPALTHGRTSEAIQQMATHYWNVIADLMVVLEKN